ncbi:hypothetical protein SLS60_000677 [Paraconiothyrium brasiliense]|uniref:Uncharacterized protein n=1 Tax=Paraconiothyrium brasiliense TaxID=300254 RepID=A0ABR3S715_9PLEO
MRQAWKQLGLFLSLPLNHEPTHGKLRVNINRYDPIEQRLTSADISIASSHGTDIRPPEGIPILLLESIGLNMAICETRNRALTRKRPKREAAKPAFDFGEVELFVENGNSKSNPSYRLDPLQDPICQSKVADQGDYTRVRMHLSETPSELNFDKKPGPSNRGKRKAPPTSSELAAIEVMDPILSQSARIMVLTDAGLRFSICLHLRGSPTDLRVKANTFIYGLSNVAPALWRAGYTSVCCIFELKETSLYTLVADPMQTCAHVMYTAPTLTRSLDRIALSARSTVLKGKLAALNKFPTGKHHEQGSSVRNLVGEVTSTITNRLWCHVQKTQLFKPTFGSLQTLCDPWFQATSAEADVEILEEYKSVDPGHPGEGGGRMHGSTRNDLFDSEQSRVQGHTTRTDSNHAVVPNTTNSQCRNSFCPTSSSIDSTSTTMISQPLDDGVAEEEDVHFECSEVVRQNSQQVVRTSYEAADAEEPWASEMAIPRTDDEDMLFNC